ncbi:hypothetical protein [Flavobacterium solisilvae]|uniref:DUF5666 domain-containing protein n=1 Tax=Flavobacterium solisilvae TaxID=1852019 RepID=A0ABX1QW36_9FLAO|nr:hypothetical protein [Flavobacterium solisilvae]NMH25044.1 hypothetical protein [Flavobacterium solisilvae]
MKKIFFLFLIISNICNSQQNYEFFGALKLNGNVKEVITYRIVFTEINGNINGFSITDLGGNHETKNKIAGSYNKKTKEIKFKEEDILYTKSALSDNVFCFVNFSGKVKLVDSNNKIEGSFKGFFKNKTNCIDGTLVLVGVAKIEKKLFKLSNKVQKSKNIDKNIKEKVNPVALLDSLKVNSLTKNQNLNVFIQSDEIEIQVWDAKIEDGDRIDLFHNGRRILDNYVVVNKKKTLKVKLVEDKNQFRIEAINEGERVLNTAMIRIIDGDRNFDLTSNLKKGEKASITIVKN